MLSALVSLQISGRNIIQGTEIGLITNKDFQIFVCFGFLPVLTDIMGVQFVLFVKVLSNTNEVFHRSINI